MKIQIDIFPTGHCSFDVDPNIPFMLSDAIKKAVRDEVSKFYKEE